MPAGSSSVAQASATRTMRASVMPGPRRVEIEHLVVPEPGPGEVRVRVDGCGVCGSNLPLWEGRPWFEYPGAAGSPGHEGWGVIDALGQGVSGPMVGQRVAALSYRAFAEFDIASAGSVVPLPESLADAPFPGEPLGCAMNVFRRSEIEAGNTVVIIGIGFLGAVLTRLASHAGARVIAISRRPFALELARHMGAHVTIKLDDHDAIIQQILKLTGGEGADRVIEVIGMQSPLDLAGELTRTRGRLIIAGYHQDAQRQVNMQLWNWRGIDVINAHEREPGIYVEGIRRAVDAVAAGVLDPGPLYTHSFGLDELERAFEMMSERPDGFLKALVRT